MTWHRSQYFPIHISQWGVPCWHASTLLSFSRASAPNTLERSTSDSHFSAGSTCLCSGILCTCNHFWNCLWDGPPCQDGKEMTNGVSAPAGPSLSLASFPWTPGCCWRCYVHQLFLHLSEGLDHCLLLMVFLLLQGVVSEPILQLQVQGLLLLAQSSLFPQLLVVSFSTLSLFSLSPRMLQRGLCLYISFSTCQRSLWESPLSWSRACHLWLHLHRSSGCWWICTQQRRHSHLVYLDFYM